MPAINWSEEKKQNYRWLIYGPAGAGKTYSSTFLKGRLYILSLDNSYHRIKQLQGVDGWVLDPEKPIEDLTEFVREFNPADYDVLVIDNLSNLQKLWFIEMAKESKNGLDNQLKHYNEFSNWLIRFISKVFSWDINILVTAWEKRSQVTDPSGQIFEQYGPDLRDSARDYLMGNCDVVARIIQKPKTGERGCILQGSIDTYAKNRLDDRKGCLVEELFDFDADA